MMMHGVCESAFRELKNQPLMGSPLKPATVRSITCTCFMGVGYSTITGGVVFGKKVSKVVLQKFSKSGDFVKGTCRFSSTSLLAPTNINRSAFYWCFARDLLNKRLCIK
jgi:hypothetical protein